MRLTRLSFFIILLFLFITGCGDEGPVDLSSEPLAAEFDSVWVNFDRNYIFFEFKETDWDLVYSQYRPKAEYIFSYDDLVSICVEMLLPLQDDHVIFVRPDGNVITTSNKYYKVNWKEESIENFKQNGTWNQVSSTMGWTKIGDIGFWEIKSWSSSNLDMDLFDQVLDSLSSCGAIIIDERMNGGGNAKVVEDAWNRFTDKVMRVGFDLLRDGPEHENYSVTPVYSSPRGAWQYLEPVVVLTGRASASAAEIFASGISSFDNVTIIGDTTRGAGGAPLEYKIGDGSKYYIPSRAWQDKDGRYIERDGVAPDIYVPFEYSDFNDGNDPALNYAFEYLNGLMVK